MARILGRVVTALALLLASAPAAHATFQVVDEWGQLGVPPNLYQPYGVATDAEGFSYVVDQQLGEVVKFDATGTAVAAFGRGTLGLNAQSIAVDSTMHVVYVAERSANRVHRFTTTGGFLSPWTASSPADVKTDSAGNVYVVEATNATVVKRAPDGTTMLTMGGLGTADGKLSGPSGVALDALGNVYVADTGNNRIEEFDADGGFLTTWAVNQPKVIAIGGSSVFVGHAATIDRYTLAGQSTGTWTSTSAGAFSTIQGLGVSGADLLVTQQSKPTVLRLASDGTLAATWTFAGLGDGHGAFRRPEGIARAANGDIYVVDQGNYRVQRFTESGTYLGAFGSGPGGGNGQFNVPDAIAVSPTTGDVYVADFVLDRIQRFTADGDFVSVIATGGTGPGQLDGPQDLSAAADGTIYVSESINKRVQHLSATGGFLDAFSTVSAPLGVASAPSGDVYVAYQSTYIDRYSAAGQLLDTIGNTGFPYFFAYAVDVAVSADGDVYVLDWSADKVTRMSATGTFKESFGSSGGGSGQFSNPQSLVTSPDGYVYVTDEALNRVQRFGQPPATPGVPTPSTTLTKGPLDVTWDAVSDPNGQTVTYTLVRERASVDETVPSGVTGTTYTTANELEGRLRYRVVASDGQLTSMSGFTSTVVVDRTAPVAVITATSLPDYGADWFKDSATLSFVASHDPALPDGSDGSGIDETSVPAPSSRSTSGDLVASGTVADLAGNVSDPATETVHVDADAPLLDTTATAGGDPYAAGDWTVEDVTVGGACTDAQSGVADAPAPIVVDTETATGSAQRQCTDNVGHATQSTFSPVRIDRSAPGAPTITPDRAPDSGAWYRDAVTLTFAGAGDLLGDGMTAGVGVDATTLPAPKTVSTNGTTVVTATVKDLLGHTSPVASRSFQVDASPPTVSLTCPATVVQAAVASAERQAGDAESGLVGAAQTTVALDTATTGPRSAQTTATDAVGHQATATCSYTVTDKPTVEPTPIPTPTPTPIAQDTSAPRLRVTAKTLKVRRGVLALGLTSDETARATVTIVSTRKIPGRRLGGGKARTLQVVKASVTLSPTTRKLNLKLSRKTQVLLRKLRKLPVKVTVLATDAAGNRARTVASGRLSP